FVSGTWAPRLPAIKAALGLTNGELGLALAGLAVGLFAGTRLVGTVVDRVGTRWPLRLGLPLMCAALMGPALAGDLATLTLAFALLGVLAGFLDVTMNANAVAVERGHERPLMSGFHGGWSAGLVAGSAVGAGAAALDVGVTTHFAVVAAVVAALSLAATRRLLEE